MILKIKNTKVDFFNKFQMSLKFDAIASTFGFEYYLNPENDLHKELAHVGHYHKCSVEDEGQTLLTGQLITKKFKSNNGTNLVQMSGYSLPGVLQDCSIPTDVYPLQSDGLTLREIATRFLTPFGFGKSFSVASSVQAQMDEVIKKTTAKEGQSPAAYLSDLASQKNIILTGTASGGLLFTRAQTNRKPIMHFGPDIPGVEYSLEFNGQGLHSEITVMKQADIDGGNAGQATVTNPLVPFTYRPTVKVQSSGTDNDTEFAAKTARSAELKNIKLGITLDRWNNTDGSLILPNNTITIINPELFIFERSKFFIESVDYSEDQQKRTAKLNCVLPSVYDGSTPINIFQM